MDDVTKAASVCYQIRKLKPQIGHTFKCTIIIIIKVIIVLHVENVRLNLLAADHTLIELIDLSLEIKVKQVELDLVEVAQIDHIGSNLDRLAYLDLLMHIKGGRVGQNSFLALLEIGIEAIENGEQMGVTEVILG
jgi:hypothetical protein